jgi:flagellar biogenesis protein FliO
LLLMVAGLAGWSALVGLCLASGTPTPAAGTADSPAASKPAAETAEKTGLPGKPDPPGFSLGTREYDSGKLLWESLAAILVILALGGVALFVIKRVMPRLGGVRGKRLALVETLHLAPQKSVHLLQVGDRRLLVAASKENLCLLADVTDALPAEGSAPTQPKTKFVIPDLPPEEKGPTP